MTPQVRAELLLSYAHGPQRLKDALASYPPEALEFRPSPASWSLRDIVFHLAESEVHGYVRARTIMAEPGHAVQAYDQDLWAASLDASAQPLEEAVALFRLLREILARQLRALPESTWEASLQHPERGTMTLEQWLTGYEGHLNTHLAQMERTATAWRAS
jgi:hypothetical protein